MGMDIPKINKDRVVIIGGGFAGIELAKQLKNRFQVVLIDRNNFHTFQPLLYQVATAGIEPDSIVFPLRKLFGGYPDFHIRMAEVKFIAAAKNSLVTSIGDLEYDHLVLATGANTSYFGMEEVRKNSMPMKSVQEALNLRSCILENFELAVTTSDEVRRDALMTYVIAGGGPTGVELAGALAELKTHVLPNDYPELDFRKMEIILIDSGDRLLGAMAEISSRKAKLYLEKMGVNVRLNTRVTGYDGTRITTAIGDPISAHTLIWAAGVAGQPVNGIPADAILTNGRVRVNEWNRVNGTENIYAIGDVAMMEQNKYPKGHPQVAQVAIQQGKNLGRNLISGSRMEKWKKFSYRDKGSMATIGRNRAVAETKQFKTQGIFAWFIWMFVHLLFLIGFRNRFVVFFNWLNSYFSYDHGIRLIIRPFKTKTNE